MRYGTWFAIPVLAVASVTAAHIAARAAEPLHIRQGWGVTTTFAPMIFTEPGILRHYGKSYVVDPIRFTGSSPELTALAAGEVDIITIAFSTFPFAVQNAQLTDLRIVADGFQDGVDGFLSQPYMVRKDDAITTVKDLKGKVIGINVIGGAVDIAARAMLKQGGLEAGKDYTIIEAPFATLPAMLDQKKVDLMSTVPPFIYSPELEARTRTLFTMKDAMGASQLIMLAARAGFLEKHRAALDDFFEDLVRGTRWMENPGNRTQAIALAARFAKEPPERIAGYYLTKRDEYRDPDCLPNIDALQRNIDTERRLGFLKSEFDVKKYVELSFVKRAAERLKK
jgi:sulfonate transport system substrate-binding protein